jgi:hypothetical protein
MVWSIETDDFLNTCGLGKFPLLTTINSGLSRSQTSTVGTTTHESVSVLPSRSTPLNVNYGRSLLDILIFSY